MNAWKSLEILAESFGRRASIPDEYAERLLKLLDEAPDVALEMLVLRRVKFLWMPAQRRLEERKAKKLAAALSN